MLLKLTDSIFFVKIAKNLHESEHISKIFASSISFVSQITKDLSSRDLHYIVTTNKQLIIMTGGQQWLAASSWKRCNGVNQIYSNRYDDLQRFYLLYSFYGFSHSLHIIKVCNKQVSGNNNYVFVQIKWDLYLTFKTGWNFSIVVFFNT